MNEERGVTLYTKNREKESQIQDIFSDPINNMDKQV